MARTGKAEPNVDLCVAMRGSISGFKEGKDSEPEPRFAQERLADLINVSRNTVSRRETGVSGLDTEPTTLYDLILALCGRGFSEQVIERLDSVPVADRSEGRAIVVLTVLAVQYGMDDIAIKASGARPKEAQSVAVNSREAGRKILIRDLSFLKDLGGQVTRGATDREQRLLDDMNNHVALALDLAKRSGEAAPVPVPQPAPTPPEEAKS